MRNDDECGDYFMLIIHNRGGVIERVWKRATGIRKMFGRNIRWSHEQNVAARK